VTFRSRRADPCATTVGMQRTVMGWVLACSVFAAAACATRGDFGGGPVDDGGLGESAFAPLESGASGLDVQPSAEQDIDVTCGANAPTVPFKATVSAGWNVDRAEIGTMSPTGPSTTSTFVPSGATGGVVTVMAKASTSSVTRAVFVKLGCQQNGPNGDPREKGQIPKSVSDLGAGGGVGGVGGEGLGPAVTDPATLAALGNPSGDGSAQSLRFLYPYDATVWPRGMLAPLLMWDWTVGDADAIEIDLHTTSGSFSWSGTFARPSILQQTGGKFVHHPIPQDVWDMATNTAGTMIHGARDKLVLSVTLASNGKGYGPITETWNVAPARLTGSVYYNAYGTKLTTTADLHDAKGNAVAGAVLKIRSGDASPSVVTTQCRVCHVVSSRGQMLLAQGNSDWRNYNSFTYDLSQTSPSPQSISPDGRFAWAALTSDGSLAFTNTAWLSRSNPAVNNDKSELWQMGSTPTKTTWTGLSSVAAGFPAFAPDDKLMAFVDLSKATPDSSGGVWDVLGPLTVAPFDATTHAFSTPTVLATPAPGQRFGSPTFLPDDSAVVYETHVRDGDPAVVCGFQSEPSLDTRNGARGEIWWVNVNGAPHPVALAALNGKGYLPLGPNNHGGATASDPMDPFDETNWDDTTLAYEPTVLPIAAGGYAWVVFTSRRMYGNELQSVPFLSWPPSYDTTSLALGTVKKLWVAAIDLNAPPGSDPSHPAFYLPAQELLAGNSRGFWALDPCRPDGDACTSGDQCCSGGCGSGADGGLVCAPPVGCSNVGDQCTTAADCCDTADSCINGYCSFSEPN
jgi:hypothetical protein